MSRDSKLLAQLLYCVADYENEAQHERARLNSQPGFRCFSLFHQITSDPTIGEQQLADFLSGVKAPLWLQYHGGCSATLDYIQFFRALINMQEVGGFTTESPVQLFRKIVQREEAALHQIKELGGRLQRAGGLAAAFSQLDQENKGYFTILNVAQFFRRLQIAVEKTLAKLIVAFFDKDSYRVTLDCFSRFFLPSSSQGRVQLEQARDLARVRSIDTFKSNQVRRVPQTRPSSPVEARFSPSFQYRPSSPSQLRPRSPVISSSPSRPNKGLQFLNSIDRTNLKKVPQFSETKIQFYNEQLRRKEGNILKDDRLSDCPIRQPKAQLSAAETLERREQEVKLKIEENKKTIERLRRQKGKAESSASRDYMKIEEFCSPPDRLHDEELRTPGRIKKPAFGLVSEGGDEENLLKRTPIELLRGTRGEKGTADSFYEGFGR